MRLETVPVVSEPLPDTFLEIPKYTTWYQIRQQLVQYMSENRHNNDLRINEGINVELLYGSGMQPFTYHSYDDYLAKMSSPYTYMGQPDITAVSAFYRSACIHKRWCIRERAPVDCCMWR